jgi:hypothetical protein
MDGKTKFFSALENYIDSAMDRERQDGSIQVGYVYGDCVRINTVSYPYTLAVDINIYDGAKVFCQLNASKSRAVIVGC